MNEFNYLSQKEKNDGGYILILNALYTLNCYKELSSDAMVLYGILLSRFNLSVKNSMVDEKGRVYVLLSIASIMDLLNVAKGTARKVVNELEKCLLLKVEKEGGYNSKRVLYLGAISKDKTLKMSKKNCSSEVKNYTLEGENNDLSGGKVCTLEGSNNEPNRGQNLDHNNNINKYNIKNSKSTWENSGTCESNKAYDFSD